MFLIDDLLLAPLLGPLKGIVWLGRKINDVVENEFYNEDHIREELIELQMRLELDQISEEEYNSRERELLERLDALVGSGGDEEEEDG
jgi:hypothetical protein